MIQRRINTEFERQRALYLEHLISQMKGRYAQNISDWTQCSSSDDSHYLACSSRWIQENAEFCCAVVYRDVNGEPITSATGFNFTEAYYESRMETVEIRLIQAGVRLAAVINKIVEIHYTEKEPDYTDETDDTDQTQSATLPRLSYTLIPFILMYVLLLH